MILNNSKRMLVRLADGDLRRMITGPQFFSKSVTKNRQVPSLSVGVPAYKKIQEIKMTVSFRKSRYTYRESHKSLLLSRLERRAERNIRGGCRVN